MNEKLEKVIKEEIRPKLQEHGGDISLVSMEEGIVKIKLRGACHNCPGAQLTMEELVKEKIQGKIPEIKDVILDTDVSEELLSFARELLKK